MKEEERDDEFVKVVKEKRAIYESKIKTIFNELAGAIIKELGISLLEFLVLL